jgi:hypothetical protein
VSAKGIYVYGSIYSPDYGKAVHGYHARGMRKYAKRSLNMKDGPKSAELARFYGGGYDARNRWYPLPVLDKRTCVPGVQCNRSHNIPAEEIRKFCLTTLEMEEITPTIVEVEKIIEIEVEVPMALSFEERDILTSALHREQHVANEMLRRAYETDEVHDIRMHTGRVTGILDLMRRFGIEPDAWANGPVWLVDTNFARITADEEQPGVVIDVPDGLFDRNGEPNAL